MHGLPSVSERLQALEDDVDVLYGRRQIERALERGRIQSGRDLLVAEDELAKVALPVPRLQRMALHNSIGVAALEPRTDEREQQPVREDEAVGGIDVAAHPLGVHDEAVDDPTEPVEHVVECEEGIW